MATQSVVSFLLKGDNTDVLSSLNEIDESSVGTYKKLDNLKNAFSVGLAVSAGLAVKAVVDLGREYESKMSSIKALTGATDEQMGKLESTIKQLGASSAFSAGEVADAAQEFLKAGVSEEQLLNGALKDGLDLAIAGNLGLADSAQIASTVLNTFSNDALSVAEAGNILAGAANSSATDISGLQLGMSMVGTVASGMGVTFKDTATALAVFAQNGLKGSDAGTSLKTMLLNLQPQTKKQTQLFKDLGLIAKDGSNKFFDAKGKMKSLSEVSQILADSTKNLTDQQKSQTLEQMFGTDAIRAANIMVKEGAQGFDTMARSMSKVKMADVAAEKMNNLNGVLEEISGAFETIAINIYQSIQPALMAVAKSAMVVVQSFANLPQPIQMAIVAVGTLTVAFKAMAKVKAMITSAQVAMKLFGNETVSTTGKSQKGISGMTNSLKSLINPTALAVTAISAIGLAFVDAYNKEQEFKKLNSDVGKAIVGTYGQGEVAIGSYQQSLIDSRATMEESIAKADEMSNMLALPIDSSNLEEYANTAKTSTEKVVSEIKGLQENQVAELGKLFSESSALSKDKEKTILENAMNFGNQQVTLAEETQKNIGDLTTKIASEKDLEKRAVLIEQYREELAILENIKNEFASEKSANALEGSAKQASIGGVTDEERETYLTKEKEFYQAQSDIRSEAYSNQKTLLDQQLENGALKQEEYNSLMIEADKKMQDGILSDTEKALNSREALYNESLNGLEVHVTNTGDFISFSASQAQKDMLGVINELPPELAKIAAKSAGIEWKVLPDEQKTSAQAEKVGLNSGKGLEDGLDSSKNSVSEKGKEVAQSGKDGMSQVDASQTGVNFVDGFLNGMASKQGSVSSIASSIGTTALASIKKSGDVRSPSRKMAEVGKWYTLGFSKGMEDNAKKVAEVAQKMGQMAIKNTSLSKTSKVINNVEFEQRSSQMKVNELEKARDLHMSTAVSPSQKKAIQEYYNNLIAEEKKASAEAVVQLKQDNALNSKLDKQDTEFEKYKSNNEKKKKKKVAQLDKEEKAKLKANENSLAKYKAQMDAKEKKELDKLEAQLDKANNIKNKNKRAKEQKRIREEMQAVKNRYDKLIDKRKDKSKNEADRIKDSYDKLVEKEKAWFDRDTENKKKLIERNKLLIQQQYDLVEASEEAIKNAQKYREEALNTNSILSANSPSVAQFGKSITSNTSNMGDVILNFGDVSDPTEIATRVQDILNKFMTGVKDAPNYR